jgi:uncharacterized protein (DUF2252 family)
MLRRSLIVSLLVFTSCASQSAPALQGQDPGILRAAATHKRDPLPLIRKFHAPLIARAPALVQLKYQAMQESPFAFYRATAFLYYQDVAQMAALQSPIHILQQGDFHLENLGTYRAGNTYAYDLNDFDEAFQGPWIWELARCAVSVQLAAEEAGFSKSERDEFVAHLTTRYLTHLQALTQQPGALRQPLGAASVTEKPRKALEKAAQFNPAEWIAEMTVNGRFRPSDKVQPVSPAIAQEVAAAVTNYASQRREPSGFFRVKDTATRIAGKGSLGLYRYLALVEGATPAPGDDHILEIKEAITPSAQALQSRTPGNGNRIVKAFHYFLPGADPLLGTTQIHRQEAYIRELLPKETVNLEKINKKSEYRDFLDTVALVAARAHARSQQGARILQEAQSPQALHQRIGPFAQSYAAQVQSDFETFRRSGGR